MSRGVLMIAGLAVLLAGPLAAQQPTAPKFEVISIKAVPPNAPLFLRDANYQTVLPGGHFRDERTSLLSLIAFAYDEKFGMRVIGIPDSVNRSYDIEAKASPGGPELSPAENREQVRLMVRAMLADRFHVQVHKEPRQERVFTLELASGGFKFKPVDPPVPPETEGYVNAAMGNDHGRVIGKRSTMRGFATMLTIMLHRTVTDHTGDSNYYDFDVRYSAPDTAETVEPGFGTLGEALLMSALREKFGLRLVAGTGPVEYLVVDHVEPPTEN